MIFGTYKLTQQQTASYVFNAIQLGVTKIDTAQLYKNEEQVWEVVKDNPKISVTTKIHRNLIKNSDRDNRIESSIVGHPSLVLLHEPARNFTIAWEQLKRLSVNIGVSNFNIEHLKQLSSHPHTNQIEVSPYFVPIQTINYCQQNKILVQGHSVFSSGKTFTEFEGCDVLNWAISLGVEPVFGVENIEQIKQNLKPTNLTETKLSKLNENWNRFCVFKKFKMY